MFHHGSKYDSSLYFFAEVLKIEFSEQRFAKFGFHIDSFCRLTERVLGLFDPKLDTAR